MSEQLGMCDKRQYEHNGPHRLIAENGQNLPPFPCVGWHPVVSESPLPQPGDRRHALGCNGTEICHGIDLGPCICWCHPAESPLPVQEPNPDRLGPWGAESTRQLAEILAAPELPVRPQEDFEKWYANTSAMQKCPCSTTHCMKEAYRLAWNAALKPSNPAPTSEAGEESHELPAFACMFCRNIELKECDYGKQCAYTHPPFTSDELSARRQQGFPNEDLYLIQDTRSYEGNSVFWWRPHGRGYTTDIGEAWKVSKDEAERMHRDRPTDVAWPAAAIEAKATRQFDMQLLRDIPKQSQAAPRQEGKRE